ncbi:MAG: hypothetical protein ACJ741_16315 [Pyrinomonadaceae bacterium]
MSRTKRATAWLTLAALAALVTLGIFRAPRRVQAQTDQIPPATERISFGLIGITRGETVRLSVANTLPPPRPDLGEFPPGPTRVVLTFLNGDGQPFHGRDGAVVSRTAQLEPGRSTFLDLDADDLQFPPGPTRFQLRAVVTVIPPSATAGNGTPPPIGDRTVSSVEVFNSSNGRTVVFIGNPGVIRGFNPQPDPPLGN